MRASEGAAPCRRDDGTAHTPGSEDEAGGPQDLVDVAMLVLLHPSFKERTLDLASAHGSDGTLARWLEDPRMKARLPRSTRPRKAARKRT